MADVDVPIKSLTAAAYRIPTGQPETDGTMAWDGTTMVDGVTESMLFDGTLSPEHGVLRPDLSVPGHGLTLRHDEAERFRVR